VENILRVPATLPVFLYVHLDLPNKSEKNKDTKKAECHSKVVNRYGLQVDDITWSIVNDSSNNTS